MRTEGLSIEHTSGQHGKSAAMTLGRLTQESALRDVLRIKWQDGPAREHGINGVQSDDVLEIVRDRLLTQNAALFSRETMDAIANIEIAIAHLKARTQDRTARWRGGDERGMKYRKKPVVIEAMPVPKDRSAASLIAWGQLAGWFAAHEFEGFYLIADGLGIDIVTLEGTMRAAPGDWIIRGVAGEFYPCKDAIFAETYEPA